MLGVEMTKSKNASILFLIIVIVYFLGSWTIYRLRLKGIEMPTYPLFLVSQGLIVIPGILFLFVTKSNPLQYIPYKKIKISNLLLVVLCTYLMVPLMSTISMISQLFVKNTMSEAMDSLLNGPFWINFIFIAISPAIFEEFVFRGIMFHTVRNASIKYGVILSSIMFGMIHLNINQFCYTVFMGMFFALLIEATGSIYSSMTAHLVINGNSVILLTLVNYITKKSQELGIPVESLTQQSGQPADVYSDLSLLQIVMVVGTWIVISIGATVLAALVFMYLCKRCNRWEHIKSILKTKKTENVVTFPFVLGISFCLIFMVYTEFFIS